jgi:hypothetical protein
MTTVYTPNKALKWYQNFYLFVMQATDESDLQNAPTNLESLAEYIFVPNRVYNEYTANVLKDYFSGMTRKEIAQKYGVTTGTISNRLHYRLERLTKGGSIKETLKQGEPIGFSEEDSLYNIVELDHGIIWTLQWKLNIRTLEDFTHYTAEDLLAVRGFGEKKLRQLETYLRTTKYRLKDMVDEETELEQLRRENKELKARLEKLGVIV